ncbi:phospholipid-transporting ATPase ABCA1 [Hyalella azteca]|uniref:Phospholipid-transporting ATPase ABCA1 n=1 Tax=Hyalella azteca TaxID=294128 RepID=A0A8B7PRA6_HYAAZ|nr:phospholipid-transporting ATPase ABCA1 [Hyalella azteca]
MGNTKTLNDSANKNSADQKWYSKLRLLIWKNFLLRKRHWILTIFEVLLPTLLFALLVSIRVLPDSIFTPTFINETSRFPAVKENDLRASFCLNSGGEFLLNNTCSYARFGLFVNRKILWGPNSSFTSALIQRIQADLNFYDEDLLVVESNDDLNNRIGSLYLQSNGSGTAFFIGIFFNGVDKNTVNPPENLNYDLRFQKYWFTDLEYPYLQIPGPRNYTSNYEYLGSYATGGFSLVQTIVDRHYTSMLAGDNSIASLFMLETQMYPYPPYVQDNAMSQFYGSSLPTFVVLSLILLSPTLIKSIVHEKETGVRELVRLMGLEGWLVWLGWFLHGFITIVLITIIMTFFLKVEITPSSEIDKGVFPPILIYSNWFFVWFLLFLYGISSIAFCFAISCFFNRPTLATTIGILAWLLSYSLPRTFMYAQYDSMGLAPKIVSCLLPNMALTWAFRVIAMFEGRAVGVQWNNLWDTGNPRDELTPGMILIMLAVDILIYFIITWYFDQVLPGTYGVPQPWTFPFRASYWCPSRASGRRWDEDYELGAGKSSSSNFEKEPVGMKAGIVIKNLRKEFPALGGGIKVAVKDVNLSCYEGQCTVLLGHNGAGKTTTMSVITGVYTASGGTAEIQGYDITSNLKQARAQVGLCPQHNTLFADLSVKQHLLFFAQLKGCSKSEASREAKELMQRMQLTEKMDQYGNQLSGGMKRKLCLCIALVGGSKIVILDEPSSGLDPESRRWVWNVIQTERKSRTVLVTTHHMEEADVLGDRIAIMAEGEVVCSGSTLFLKRRFGDGYSLRVLPRKSCDIHMVTTTIKTIMPEATLTTTTEEELLYSLSGNSDSFARLLETLSARKDYLKINHVGLSITSMEQVFLKVGEVLHSSAPSGSQHSIASTDKGVNNRSFTMPSNTPLTTPATFTNGHAAKPDRYAVNSQTLMSVRASGNALLWERLKALWKKHVIYTRRKWVLLLTQGLVPVLVTLMCLLVDAAYFGDNAAEPPRELTLDMFEWSQSYVQSDDSYLTSCYVDQFYGPYRVNVTDDVIEELLAEGNRDVFHYRENDVTSAMFYNGGSDKKVHTRMLYQSIPYHAPGVGINLISNAILQGATNSSDHTITTSNYPLPLDERYRLEDGSQSGGSAFIYSLMMPTAMAFLSASFLIFPLQERESKAKQIQLMTGTSSTALWFTTFTWDMLSYTASILIMFALFMIIDAQGNFTLQGAPVALILLMLLYGWSALPMAYLFSFPFSSAASGFAILALFNIVAGMVVSIATYALDYSEQPGLMTLSDVLSSVFSLIPSYPVSQGFLNLVQMSSYNTQCDIVDPSLVDELCKKLIFVDPTSLFLPCCPMCDQLPGDRVCFQPLSYLQWEAPGMGKALTWLAADGIIFIIIIALIEIGIGDKISTYWAKLWRAIRKPKQGWMYVVPEDEDVMEEARLAEALMRDENPDASLVVRGLTKVFPAVGLTAVNNISFKVNVGECFGLLGVNGAGKTTTFRMLTGDETPTAGDARIGKYFLSAGRRKFVREIGYCPQFDAILDELTGDEMLDLMAGLRGVPQAARKLMIEEFVELVDLTECHKRQTSTYSGGNKRKLSTAMALVGGPSLVFLDEPTTGVDPASRRRVWSAIRTARSRGQSIILTSHSMDECEALCSRLVILVRGQLRCAGTPAHLKAKFSQGYSLQVKLSPGDERLTEEAFSAALRRLMAVIDREFPGSVLTDQHRGMLSYMVTPDVTWAHLLSVMERLKNGDGAENMSLVEDYAATDPSLEQVFLAFAREADEATANSTTSKGAPDKITHF